ELDSLGGLLKSKDKGLRVILISGPGGIGKTTLLNLYQSQVEQYDARARSVPVIDLADPIRRSVESVLTEIALKLENRLGKSVFEPYQNDLDLLSKLEFSGANAETISFHRKRLPETYTQCYNSITNLSKIALLLDSAEYVINDDFWINLFSIARNLKRTLLFIAGRPEGIATVSSWARTRIVASRVVSRELKPLRLQDASKLFEARMDPALKRNVYLLTEGRPILLVLAADRMRRGIDLPDLAKKPFQGLQPGQIEEIRSRFEATLVDFLLEPRSEIDQIILWMGHLDKRFDSEFIRKLSGRSSIKSKSLMEELRRIPYVKLIGNKAVLHEDVVKLIRKNVWELIDPRQDARRELSRKAGEIIDARIVKLGDDHQEKRQLLNEMMRQRQMFPLDLRQYRLAEDLLKEYKYERAAYNADYDTVRAIEYIMEAYDSHGDSYYRKELLALAKSFEERMPVRQRFEISIRRARWLISERIFDEAELELAKWSGRDELSGHQKADLLSAQANLQRLSGNLPQALERLDQAINLASIEAPNLVPQLTQTKGFFSRLMGRWDDAIRLYEAAINTMQRETDIEKLRLANAINNLAFVYGQRGNWVAGLQWCERALKLKQEVGGPSDIAVSLITLGSLFWAKGEYMQARKLYDQALALVELPLDSEIQARAYFSYGIADWFAQDYPEAGENFEKAIAIIREHDFYDQLSLTIHDLGHIKWELGETEVAEDLFREGYSLSKKYHDYQALTDTLVGLAELYYKLGRSNEIYPYVEELKALEEQGYRFPLFAGRMERILGEVAFDQGDYQTAKGMFIKGLLLIAEHGGYGKYSLRDEFLRLGHRMDQLPQNIVLEWCTALEDNWLEDYLVEGRREMEAFVRVRRVIPAV
ncbi:MAG: tetratricopeptide repeat protein, partial [Nitrososphaera sp.]|nr:tetratricopeptide repeat protein [Nitrososphaera sp.]